MAYTYYDFEVDPWNSDTPSYRLVSTAYYSGSLVNVTAPASPNYPVTSPTRYFLKLPFIIDVSDLTGTRPVQLRNVTDGVTMTRVSGAPGTNEFRLPPATSERRNVIEINAAQASKTIGFSLYAIGGIMRAEDFNSIDVTGNINGGTITTASTVRASGGFNYQYYTSLGVASTKYLATEIIEIGDWNMDTGISKTVPHYLSTDYTKIVSIYVVIRDDADSSYLSLMNNVTTDVSGNFYVSDATNVTLTRATGGIFDSASYDATSFNRGWVYIVYRVT